MLNRSPILYQINATLIQRNVGGIGFEFVISGKLVISYLATFYSSELASLCRYYSDPHTSRCFIFDAAADGVRERERERNSVKETHKHKQERWI